MARLHGSPLGEGDARFVAADDKLGRIDYSAVLEKLRPPAAMDGRQRAVAVRAPGAIRVAWGPSTPLPALASQDQLERTNADLALAKVLLATRGHRRDSLDALGWPPTRPRTPWPSPSSARRGEPMRRHRRKGGTPVDEHPARAAKARAGSLSNQIDSSHQGSHGTAKPFVRLKRLAVQKFGFWSRYQPW